MTGDDPYRAPTSALDDAAMAFARGAADGDAASRGRRLAGFAIDNAACRALDFALLTAFIVVRIATGRRELDETTRLVVGAIVLFGPLLSPLPYYFALEGWFGATLGKRLTRTRVLRADGGAPTLGQVTVRTFARWIPLEPLAILRANRECLHDSLSGTKVIRLG